VSANNTFSPRVVVALAASGLMAFALSMLLTLAGGDETLDAVGANSSSRSAIGHKGVYDLFAKLGYRVSRDDSVANPALAPEAIVIFAEPNDSGAAKDILAKFKAAKTVVLVLPKWRAHADLLHDGWIDDATLLPLSAATSPLAAQAGKGELVRVAPPAVYDTNLLGWAPTIAQDVQLIKNSALEPIVSSTQGILLGEIRDETHRLLVLADPDPIANHGVGKGDNAAFIAALIDALGEPGAPVVFNEAIHGAGSGLPSDPRKLLAQFPYTLAPLQILFAVALLLAATMGRFGAPQPAPAPLRAGKRGLIGSAAQLLDHVGHHAAMLRRYVGVMVQDAARRLRAPRDLEGGALIAWLDTLGKSRGVTRDCGSIVAASAAAKPDDITRQFAAAQAIHDWKTEILNGHSRHSRDH
jgi:hypothetical protein